MRAPITHFGRGCVSGALHLLLMINSLVSPGAAVAATACLVFGFAPAARAADSVRKAYDFPRGDAAETLKRFAEESGKQVVFLVDVVRGVTTNPVIGEFTARDAIDRMVANTGLVVVQDEKTGAIMINRTAPLTQSTRPSRSDAKPQTESVESLKPMKRGNPITLFAGWLTLALAPSHVVSAADGRPAGATSAQTGTLSGWVSNAATGNMLEGATVKLPEHGLATLTDSTGRFVFTGVPAGTYEVIASYIGLDQMRSKVVIAADQRSRRDFDLVSNIYRMQEFKVSGEREGNAAAITAQRNADNVKNVIATDAFGNLPNLAASELVIRLPGVAGITSLLGVNSGYTVRGMGPGLNSVTLDDGQLVTGGSATERESKLHDFSAAMIESVELIKGHTPDKGADSLGGTVNLKSRSTLNLKEKRRINFNVSARWAPPFTQQIPLVQAHPLHPLINGSYQEIFNVLGKERNLGVAVNLYYNEITVNRFSINRDYQNTTTTPAYLWDYTDLEQYTNQKLWSANVKLEYRLSPATKLTLNTTYNDNNNKNRRYYAIRMYTAQTVGTSGAAGILPGYTDRVTQVRAAPGSTIDSTASLLNTWYRMAYVSIGAEHDFGRLQIDYTAMFNYNHVNSANDGEGGTLVNRITNVGWINDRTRSDLYPRFTQTEGLDFTNPANYRPAVGVGFNNANLASDRQAKEVRGNARYKLPTKLPVFLKTGFNWREMVSYQENTGRRWEYIGVNALPADPSILLMHEEKTGLRVPLWEAAAFFRGREPITPSLWQEDLYFHEQIQFTGTRTLAEKVTAGYIMAHGKIGRTGFLTGVRTERTEVDAGGWVRARTASSAALRLADPIGAAKRDYANTRREIAGNYTKSFPSAHLTQELTSNLKTRFSWSTSFGRPSILNLLPTETANENLQILSIGNPGLKPQTASNWDATLDYYFEPVGNLSIGWFHKTIKDYIVSGINNGTVPSGTDNGYNGEYAGLTVVTAANAGTAFVQGWEFSYQQQFTFLPGLLKGLSGLVNYTIIDTHGNFGGTLGLSAGQVAGFIPRTGNASLSWRYRNFSTRVLVNYISGYLESYTATAVGRNIFRFGRTVVNLGLEYRLRPTLSLTCDIANLFDEPIVAYRGIPAQMQANHFHGTTITFGVNGRF